MDEQVPQALGHPFNTCGLTPLTRVARPIWLDPFITCGKTPLTRMASNEAVNLIVDNNHPMVEYPFDPHTHTHMCHHT